MKNHLPYFFYFHSLWFKIVKNNDTHNYKISEIITSGEKESKSHY